VDIALITYAVYIGIIHTAIGIDHYIPFAVMSKSNAWSNLKTLRVVLLCGFAHVFSSVLIGLAGIWIGSQLTALTGIQDIRAEVATWFIISFGAVYMLWGFRKAEKNKPHTHLNAEHTDKKGGLLSFWPLFIIFVLGPCELLIPALMYPAAEANYFLLTVIIAVFAVCTIGSMVVCTFVALKGISFIPMKKVERYSHALAGFAVFVCGWAIFFFDI
jgi:sulfite exporter TauE/SafE